MKLVCGNFPLLTRFCFSGVSLRGSFFWVAASFLKRFVLNKFGVVLYSWTSLFAHPEQASLINYAGACLGMFFYGVLCYFFLSKRVMSTAEASAADIRQFLFVIAPSLVLLALFSRAAISYRAFINAGFGFILLVTLRYFVPSLVNRVNRSFLISLVTFVLFVLVCLEPISLLKGPIYLMNEYRKPFSQTLINGTFVKNDVYLHRITDADKDLNADERTKSSGPERSISEFYKKNRLEYSQANSGRGQVHHIGHILNPLNEYESGKRYRDIYMQYGFGNMLLYKWTMGLFGSISVQNYYKCYVYYVIYAVLFVLMTYVVFGNTIYVLGVFSVFVISHFAYDYLVFIVAPGIIPTLHLFDVVVIIFLTRYFQKENFVYLAGAVIMTGLGLVLSLQFGFLLTVAVLGTLIFYLGENKHHRMRHFLSIALLLLFLVISVLPFIDSGVQKNIFSYFAFGWFSWMPPFNVIVLTLLLFSVSYYFLVAIREKRFPLKYVYFFVFMYTQGLFTYYYWSGQSNHLPLVVPFIGLQIMMMIFLSLKIIEPRNCPAGRYEAVGIVILLSVVLALSSVQRFYIGKDNFTDNFAAHKTFIWKFERANLITTIDPEPIRESVDLIRRYATRGQDGIYLLSEYDNLLPFLAHRYSMMPLFDMSWYIMSEREYKRTVDLISSCQPRYIFADTDLADDVTYGWDRIFNRESDKNERTSHSGRYRQLKRLLSEVKKHYKKIEEGSLISVYEQELRAATPKILCTKTLKSDNINDL